MYVLLPKTGSGLTWFGRCSSSGMTAPERPKGPPLVYRRWGFSRQAHLRKESARTTRPLPRSGLVQRSHAADGATGQLPFFTQDFRRQTNPKTSFSLPPQSASLRPCRESNRTHRADPRIPPRAGDDPKPTFGSAPNEPKILVFASATGGLVSAVPGIESNPPC